MQTCFLLRLLALCGRSNRLQRSTLKSCLHRLRPLRRRTTRFARRCWRWYLLHLYRTRVSPPSLSKEIVFLSAANYGWLHHANPKPGTSNEDVFLAEYPPLVRIIHETMVGGATVRPSKLLKRGCVSARYQREYEPPTPG